MALTTEEKLAKKRAYAKAHPQTAEYKRATYFRNREKALERAKRYAVERADEIAAYQKAYVEANKDAIKAYQTAYHEANADVAREKRKERYDADPSTYIEMAKVRRIAQQTAQVGWNAELDSLVFAEAKDLRNRRDAMTGCKWEIDHIVPIKSKIVCGLHAYTNIAVIPRKHNKAKSNRIWPNMPEAI